MTIGSVKVAPSTTFVAVSTLLDIRSLSKTTLDPHTVAIYMISVEPDCGANKRGVYRCNPIRDIAGPTIEKFTDEFPKRKVSSGELI